MEVEQTPAAVRGKLDGVESGLADSSDLPISTAGSTASSSKHEQSGDRSGDRLLVGLFVDAPRWVSLPTLNGGQHLVEVKRVAFELRTEYSRRYILVADRD